MDNNSFKDKRIHYSFDESTALDEHDVNKDPFIQFKEWFSKVFAVDPLDANVMFLATCGADYVPCVRTVLLKEFDQKGFVFFTNYNSRKGIELAENPYACLLFYWKEFGRQVRIEGSVEKTSRKESESYFHSRPFESQIAALASVQSSIIPDRKFLDSKYDELLKEYTGVSVPHPDHWGGYRVVPHTIEFWQGRENRMHDRVLYTLSDGEWKIERLSP